MFDLLVGISRWLYRVLTYVALLHDAYPPFRLDQGPYEPGDVEPDPPLGHRHRRPRPRQHSRPRPLRCRPMTTQNRTREQTPRPGWPVPVALAALSAIPLITGALRLLQLAGGPELIPAEERFAGFPLPVALHILGAAAYVLLGALQFVPQFRRQHRTWHRRTGRILIVAGLLVAASAVWMTLLYAAKPGTGDLLYVLRLVFGCALVACLVLGFAAVRRRKIPAHSAWMIRAYAIALAAGTQAFTQGLSGALFGIGEL